MDNEPGRARARTGSPDKDNFMAGLGRKSYGTISHTKVNQFPQINRINNTCWSVENFITNPTDHGLNNQYNDQGVKGNTQPADPLNDNDVTVIVKNLPFTEGENLQDKVQQIIDSLGEVSSQISVVATKRLTTRFHNKPGLVKISFQSQDQKILILRNKHKLKDVGYYKHVYIQSSKSRIERLIETNTRTILRELPQGKSYRVTANGKILKKSNEPVSDTDNTDMETKND
ncbi:unnamed protein product [Mytilus edulis]|uniref:Uncharacterized protein n=1 Tax=Mytilus edulis TaxID=6550 RepID=A0A8S3UAM5_MYTED|nr:unnamed protein product [Mytilus edulis]